MGALACKRRAADCPDVGRDVGRNGRDDGGREDGGQYSGQEGREAREGEASAAIGPRGTGCLREECVKEDCAASSSAGACGQAAPGRAKSSGSWIYAVEHCNAEALLGADLAATDAANGNRTALQACVASGWLEGVESLLRHGVDPSAADDQAHTALHAAAKLGRGDMVSLLIAAAADINAQDRDMDNDEEFRGGHYEKKTTNRMALHYAAENLDHDICGLLLAQRALVDGRDCWYKTPLHLVEDEPASSEQLRAAGLLLARGADPGLGNLERGPGQTSLLAAVHGKNLALAELLIRSRADVRARGKQGMGVLHLAARMRSRRLVQALLDGRADPLQKNAAGRSAADLARANGCADLFAAIEHDASGDGAKDGRTGQQSGPSLMDELS